MHKEDLPNRLNTLNELTFDWLNELLTEVWSNFCFLGQVGSAIFGLGLTLANFTLKSHIFQFFALQVKKNSSGRVKKYPGRLLIYYGSKVCLGWIGLGPISSDITIRVYLKRHSGFGL